MTKLEFLKKEIEEKFSYDGYSIIDIPDFYYIRIKTNDGIFGGKFLRMITCMKMPFFIDCNDKEIYISRYDLAEYKE